MKKEKKVVKKKNQIFPVQVKAKRINHGIKCKTVIITLIHAYSDVADYFSMDYCYYVFTHPTFINIQA